MDQRFDIRTDLRAILEHIKMLYRGENPTIALLFNYGANSWDIDDVVNDIARLENSSDGYDAYLHNHRDGNREVGVLEAEHLGSRTTITYCNALKDPSKQIAFNFCGCSEGHANTLEVVDSKGNIKSLEFVSQGYRTLDSIFY